MASEGLFQAFEEMVGNGETTWDEVLTQIASVKRVCRPYHPINVPKIVDVERDENPYKELENRASQQPDILAYFARKELWEKLPEKVRGVARMVFNASPSDFRDGHLGGELFTPGGGGDYCTIGKIRIRSVLQRMGWKRRDIDNAFRQLAEFCASINTLD